jgi:hypothetical protein
MVTQPWYAYDTGAGATFKRTREIFLRLLQLGPDYGYYPEPTKSILVLSTANFARSKAEFADLGFKVTAGSRYLGGFIGEEASRGAWLEEEIQAWEECIQQSSSAAGIYPHSVYTGMQISLQAEYIFVQRVVRGMGPKSEGIRDKMKHIFIPALLKSKEPPYNLLKLATLPVKSVGLALPDPVTSADVHFRASEVTNSHIIQVMHDTELFSLQDHVTTTTKVKAELEKGRDKESKAALNTIINPLPSSIQSTLRRGDETGVWLTAMPSTIAGT